MNPAIPTKQECHYIFVMLKSSLVDYSYTQAWADRIIDRLDVPPSWLCDVATKKYIGDQTKAFAEYLSSEPLEKAPAHIGKFYVGCLWLRYERRELSWATYLQDVGRYLDADGAGWDCETPYHYLNQFEDEYFTTRSEEKTKKLYLKDHDILPWAKLATEKFNPLKKIRLTNKSVVTTPDAARPTS